MIPFRPIQLAGIVSKILNFIEDEIFQAVDDGLVSIVFGVPYDMHIDAYDRISAVTEAKGLIFARNT